MNPFRIGVILPDEPFCNRQKEMEELSILIRSCASVLIFSPRRYGKTSLIKRLISQAAKEGWHTVYVDFFPVTSTEDAVNRFALASVEDLGEDVTVKGVTNHLQRFFKRIIPAVEVTPQGLSLSMKFDRTAGIDYMFEDIFDGISRYLQRMRKKALLVFDEFQEITNLPESRKIEGIMRNRIQQMRNTSNLFVGSRRRILLDMFSQRGRPFYKSTINYPLEKISRDEFCPYICRQFKTAGKDCPLEIAQELFDHVEGHPYYVQKLAFFLWDIPAKTADGDSFRQAEEYLLRTEISDFEAVLQGLTTIQKRLLKTMAIAPTRMPYSKGFTARYDLSFGGTQKALKALLEKDLIEKRPSGMWELTDPVMKKWLSG